MNARGWRGDLSSSQYLRYALQIVSLRHLPSNRVSEHSFPAIACFHQPFNRVYVMLAIDM